MARNVYRSPEQLLEEFRITKPEEINLKVIAFRCGACVEEEPLFGSEAQLVGCGEKAIITVNSTSSMRRKRFSIAHELGHWLKDRGTVASVSCSDESMGRWQDSGNNETDANRFAARLLMPTSMLHPFAKNKPVTLETVRRVSDAFDTSLTSSAIRVVEADSLPGMVLCTGKNGRIWFVRGRDVPKILFPLKMPGMGSAAHELLTGKSTVYENQLVDADNWIDHPDANGYEIVENSILIAKEMVLTMLWWKCERQILDLDED